jgi:hypothetical protein
MLVVAVFSISLRVGLSYRRSVDYWRQALFYAHARESALVRARAVESGAAHLGGYTAEEKRRLVDQARRFADDSSRLRSKYERAAFLPFLSVEPDPSLP